jgi:hypothetical protein
MSIRGALKAGATETGEPYTGSQGAEDLARVQSLLKEGLELMQRRTHPDAEQGGWLGDALSFVGRAGKNIVKGVGKAITNRGGSKRNITNVARTLQATRGSAAPRGVSDLEIIINKH